MWKFYIIYKGTGLELTLARSSWNINFYGPRIVLFWKLDISPTFPTISASPTALLHQVPGGHRCHVSPWYAGGYRRYGSLGWIDKICIYAGIGLGPSVATRLIVVHGAAGWGGAGKVIGDFVFINNLLFSRLNSTRHTRHTAKWIKFIFQFNPSYRDCYWWMWILFQFYYFRWKCKW